MPQRAVVAKKTDRGSEFSTPKETDRGAEFSTPKETERANEVSAPPQGLLLVDKPAGMTSHDVVQHVRRVYGERSIGHLGTLDPFATGLLVLLLGRATRLATFIDAEPKVYEATIRFGEETDTDDATGTVIRTATVPREADLRSAVKSLTGTISQVPPAYSAKSVDGTRAYDAARRGEPLEGPIFALLPVTSDVSLLPRRTSNRSAGPAPARSMCAMPRRWTVLPTIPRV